MSCVVGDTKKVTVSDSRVDTECRVVGDEREGDSGVETECHVL